MKIAICDDSIHDSNHLKNLCLTCNSCFISDITVFNNSKIFAELYQQPLKPEFNIIFLDVDMPEMNGMKVGALIRDHDKEAIIIFTTSYPQYAINAFDCQAFHYILKPCSAEQISDILNRAIQKHITTHQHHVITMRDHYIKVLVKDIYYVEYCRRHVIYHLPNREIETTDRLQDVMAILKPYGFYQIHQGYIVNMERISELQQFDVILDNGQKVPISIRKKTEVVQAYSKYMQRYSI